MPFRILLTTYSNFKALLRYNYTQSNISFITVISDLQDSINSLLAVIKFCAAIILSSKALPNVSVTVKGGGGKSGESLQFTSNPVEDVGSLKTAVGEIFTQYLEYLDSISIASLDTGGSTGTWGDTSAKLAFLHEKELVLNQPDTQNILKAVELVRGMTDTLGAIASNEINTVSGIASGLLGQLNNTSNLDQNVHIDAHFPNAVNHSEIEQAFNNLVNIASMRAARQGR